MAKKSSYMAKDRRNAARRDMDNDVGRTSRWAKELRRRPASGRGFLNDADNGSRAIERPRGLSPRGLAIARKICKEIESVLGDRSAIDRANSGAPKEGP
ncbi:hypothetical protein KM043_017757 [Ampulex compressa]|nr:hypothetical protein KM043_017757 [Ampulex compressa]